jgi:YHS domain-containing protein
MCGQHQHDTTSTDAPETTAAPAAAAEAPSACGGHPSPAAATTEDDTAICPVMAGTPVSKATAEAAGLFRDYEGNRYWFCCAACGPLFDADPGQYAAA